MKRKVLIPFALLACIATGLFLGADSGSGIPHTSIQLTLLNRLPEARTGSPVTWAIPLSLAENITDTGSLILIRRGQEVPAQFTAMARWGGASADTSKPLSWVLVDTVTDLDSSEKAVFSLKRGTPSSGPNTLRITRNDDDGVTVDTGAAVYSLSKRSFRFFDSVTLADGTSFSGGGIFHEGSIAGNPASISIEHSGVNRISLRVHGVISGGLEYTARIHFYRGLTETRIDFRLENLTPPALDGFGQPQANDYGCTGTVSFNDLSILFGLLPSGTCRYPSGEPGSSAETTQAYTERCMVVQESGGDPNWNALQSRAPRMQSGVTKRASSVSIDTSVTDGPNQFAGWLDAGGVTIAVEKAWQNFPKAFRAGNSMIEAGLFPGEFSRNHELRPGEFKTHTFWVRHHGDVSDTGQRARSFLSPLRFVPQARYLSETMAAGPVTGRFDTQFPDYENGTDYQIVESPDWISEYQGTTVLDTVSKSQHYGWVDYGDIPTDFEGELISPYNLKYDAVRGLILHAYRNMTDETWWELASAGAKHAADIDIQHSRARGYSAPRAWYEGGMYGHGYHDEIGTVNPHRNYQNPASYLSGPAAGLFLWALVSGDTLVLESALELADNLFWRSGNSDYFADFYGAVTEESRVCAIEAGLQVCAEGECTAYEPADRGRTGGNILQAMNMAYMATGDAAYIGLVGKIARYIECYETRTSSVSCDRFHFQTTFIRNLGHYLMLRRMLGLPEDTTALSLLTRRMDYMTGTLWNPATGEFRMCYDSPALFPFHDNWLLSVADSFAAGAYLLDRTALLTDYARPLFLDGSKNQFYEGSAISFHSTKEYVNQVGFGNLFLSVWNHFNPSPVFSDVPPEHWAGSHVDAVYSAYITTGCSPGLYCPDSPVTREQMAAFIIRAIGNPPSAGTCAGAPPFSDVQAGSWACAFIERLKTRGISTGYADGTYRPGSNVTRAEMAAFIIRAREDEPPSGYCDTGTPFPDVPNDGFCRYIKRMKEFGISTGYADGTYRPGDQVTRAEMAAFLSRAFLGM